MEKGTVKRFLWLILPVIGVIFSVISSIKSIFASLSAYAYSVKRKVLLCIAIYVLCCIPIIVVLSVFSIGVVILSFRRAFHAPFGLDFSDSKRYHLQ